MDISSSLTADPHKDKEKIPAQQVNVSDVSGTMAQRVNQETLEPTDNEITLSLSKTTGQLPNSISGVSLNRVITRPSQNSLAGSRKVTPIQPVFNDFATAHSSITKNAKGKGIEKVQAELPFRKIERISEQFEDKASQSSGTFHSKLPAIPARSALRNVRNLSLGFQDLALNEAEDSVFSTRKYGSVFSPRIPSINVPPQAEIKVGEGLELLKQVPNTPKCDSSDFDAICLRPTSSIYSCQSPSAAHGTQSQVPENNGLSPVQLIEKKANIDSPSNTGEHMRQQPGLFHSTSEPVIQCLDNSSSHDLGLGSFGENVEPYIDLIEGMTCEESHNNDPNLQVFSSYASSSEEQNENQQPNESNSTLLFASDSSPHSIANAPLNIEDNHAGDDDDLDMDFFEEEDSCDSIDIRGSLPSITKMSGCPVVCPSQESLGRFSSMPYGLRTYSRESSPGKPPGISLPRLPGPAHKVHLGMSSSEVFGQSSSYGDTKNLFDFTKKSLNENIIGQPPASAPLKQHSFNVRGGPAYQSQYERDVSTTLHCINEASSDKTISPKNRDPKKDTTPSSFKSVLKNLREDQKRMSKIFSDGFYNNLQTPSRRRSNRRSKNIKIPIRQRAEKVESVELEQFRISTSSSFVAKNDDTADWETIGTDSVPIHKDNTSPFKDAAFNRTGSSIANFSDHKGESSSGPILGELSLVSSEPIIQHPARLNDGYGRYPGEIIETSSSVIDAKSGQFGTDVFLENSIRAPSKSNELMSSSLVPEASRTPIHDLMCSKSVAREESQIQIQDFVRSSEFDPIPEAHYGAKFNDRFEPSGSISTTMDLDCFRYGSFAGPSTPAPWIKGVNYLGIDMSDQDEIPRNEEIDISDQDEIPRNEDNEMDPQDPFMRMIIQANGGKAPVYIADCESHTLGSSIADVSTTTNEDFEGLDDRVMNAYNPYILQKYDFREPTERERKIVGHDSTTRNRTPLIKGPPGAFYKNLQSKAATRWAKRNQEETPTRTKSPRRRLTSIMGTTDSPSRMLRPLSLVAEALGPIKQVGPPPQAPEEYLYKSPLAPVRSPEWKGLYSQADLNRINSTPTTSCNSSPNINGQPLLRTAWSVHEGPPRLTAWIHDNSSMVTNTADRKSQISNIAVALCMFVPPALLLMRVGWLDQFMIWYTKGEISHFGKTQKRVAGYLFGGYACTAIFAVIVTLILHFTEEIV